MYMHECALCMYTYMHPHTHIYIYIYICTYVYIYIYIYGDNYSVDIHRLKIIKDSVLLRIFVSFLLRIFVSHGWHHEEHERPHEGP